MGRERFNLSTFQRPQGAFVLVAVLVLIMLVSMVAVSLLFSLKGAEAAAHAGAGAEQAWAAAMSGVQEALRVAAQAAPGVTGWQDNPRAFRDRLVFDDGADRWFYTVYSPPEEDALAEVRYGLTDEASKLNLNAAHTTNLVHLPGVTAPLVAALRDFIDWDDAPRAEGAEQEYYDALPRPYAVRNGALDTLDELLLVRGFTPALLYGEDANMNWRLDPNENDGDERFPPDNNDGRLNFGLQRLLTVFSSELNEDNEGVPRTNLNRPNDPLPGVELPPALTNYIAVLRSNSFGVTHAADLLEDKLKVKDEKGREVEVASGVDKTDLPLVLDLFTASPEDRQNGLINVNTAPIPVLLSVPGIDEPLAEAIVSTRRSIGPERRVSIAWLYQEGLVDATLFKQLAPFLTARSFQYSFRVLGYGVPSGRYRVLDVVIDLASGQPLVSYQRDITRLGLPFRIETESLTEPGSLARGAGFPAQRSAGFWRSLFSMNRGRAGFHPGPLFQRMGAGGTAPSHARPGSTLQPPRPRAAHG